MLVLALFSRDRKHLDFKYFPLLQPKKKSQNLELEHIFMRTNKMAATASELLRSPTVIIKTDETKYQAMRENTKCPKSENV